MGQSHWHRFGRALCCTVREETRIMSYVEQILQPGEQIRHVSSIHWIAYWPGVVFALLAAVAYWLSDARLLTGLWRLYSLCAGARRGRSSGPGMVEVVGHGDRGHQPPHHLQDRSYLAANQRNERRQGRERSDQSNDPRAPARLRHRNDPRHWRRQLRGTTRCRRSTQTAK